MTYTFCAKGQSMAVIFNRKNGGFTTCSSLILFPVLSLVLILVRILFIRPQCWASEGNAGAVPASKPNGFKREKEKPGIPGTNHPSSHVSYIAVDSPDLGTEPPGVGRKRLAKCAPLNSVLLWLHLLFPFNYITLMVLKYILSDEKFVLVWPTSIVLIAITWWLAVFALEVEVSRARDFRMKVKYRHNFLMVLFWVSVLLFECVPAIDAMADDWHYPLNSSLNKVELSLWVLRLTTTISILCLGIYAPGLPRKANNTSAALSEESQRLTSEDKSTFANLYSKLKFLWPYIWPKGEPMLQLYVALCFVILILGRIANVFIPLFYSKVVTSLADGQGVDTNIPYLYIVAYCGFYFLTGSGFGGSGFLSNVRSFLWIKVQQYSMRTTMVNIFSHLHSLSLRWHLGRKTGEVLAVIDRGNNSVVTLLSYILFTIVPTCADILIAICYFILAFNLYFGLIVFACLSAYVAATVTISEWRTKFRREVNKLDNATRTKAVDSLINFETVKYYGAEQMEVDRYDASLLGYQEMQWKNLASLQFLNLVQVVIVNLGLLVGCLLSAYYIVQQDHSVGSFVLFTTYIVQLYGPLNFLGTWFRMIQQSFIDMENMLDLFMEKQEVKDCEDAPELFISGGEIEFDHVSFHYTVEKPILRNVSFVVKAGSTVAVVGPSGAGKSTLIRLLFRFYDVQSGCIRIDGKDISKVTQASLRGNIGVVPQDTVLFNETIKYNIQYGRPGCGEEDVFEAARRADIHDRIEAFPDQYDTLVGERGLKLSGGEKQRVAIARTVLKAPKVILLDEATSALDTKTERNIQAALDDVSKDRTTLVVAHRLSTVVNADMIIVLKDGVIVERGTHQQLMAVPDSMYSGMWNQQATAASDNPLAPENKNRVDLV